MDDLKSAFGVYYKDSYFEQLFKIFLENSNKINNLNKNHYK
jgi:hypothetical protein